jgi:hypothetical protein
MPQRDNSFQVMASLLDLIVVLIEQAHKCILSVRDCVIVIDSA